MLGALLNFKIIVPLDDLCLLRSCVCAALLWWKLSRLCLRGERLAFLHLLVFLNLTYWEWFWAEYLVCVIMCVMCSQAVMASRLSLRPLQTIVCLFVFSFFPLVARFSLRHQTGTCWISPSFLLQTSEDLYYAFILPNELLTDCLKTDLLFYFLICLCLYHRSLSGSAVLWELVLLLWWSSHSLR